MLARMIDDAGARYGAAQQADAAYEAMERDDFA
jgi:hypothetical protein